MKTTESTLGYNGIWYKGIRVLLCTFIPLYLYTFTSCEEVIDVDLNSAESKLVIEGAITDQPGPYTVKISKTTDYYIPADYPKISGAVITISDNSGFIEHLTETEPGVYQTDSLVGIPGRTYSLKVVLEGKNYTAQSTMPLPLEIDSLTYEEDAHNFGDDKLYNVLCNFQDASGYRNFARLKVYQNNDIVNNIFLFNDRLLDGNYIRNRIRYQFDPNDKVMVELWSIEEATYTYYSTMKNAIAADAESPFNSSIPANPVSNISGLSSDGVLGYFGAFTVRTDSVIIN